MNKNDLSDSLIEVDCNISKARLMIKEFVECEDGGIILKLSIALDYLLAATNEIERVQENII